jgi:TonB-dependent SusC/RagA subfamily outer membrane receptor
VELHIETARATDFQSMAALNPDDIESIEILKDASATAIYGVRGATEWLSQPTGSEGKS